MLNWSISV
jgi:hypothetical protein